MNVNGAIGTSCTMENMRAGSAARGFNFLFFARYRGGTTPLTVFRSLGRASYTFSLIPLYFISEFLEEETAERCVYQPDAEPPRETRFPKRLLRN